MQQLALWQSALTFGMLEIICGKKVPEALLLSRQEDGQVLLTGSNMSAVLSRWLFALPHPCAAEQSHIREWANNSRGILNWAQHAIEEQVMFSERIASAAGLTPDEVDDIMWGLTTNYVLVARFTSFHVLEYPKVQIIYNLMPFNFIK